MSSSSKSTSSPTTNQTSITTTGNTATNAGAGSAVLTATGLSFNGGSTITLNPTIQVSTATGGNITQGANGIAIQGGPVSGEKNSVITSLYQFGITGPEIADYLVGAGNYVNQVVAQLVDTTQQTNAMNVQQLQETLAAVLQKDQASAASAISAAQASVGQTSTLERVAQILILPVALLGLALLFIKKRRAG